MAKRHHIPARQLAALEQLMQLTDEQYNTLHGALGASGPSVTLPGFVRNVASRATGINESMVADIVEAVCGLYFIKDVRGYTMDEVIGSILDSARREKVSPKIAADGLASRLRPLLELNRTVGVTAKARDLVTEFERYFCGVRILSDIRSVFATDGESAPAGFVIHNLALHYHQDGEHREFYVALDINDLATLKEAIARAEKKQKVLQDNLTKAGVEYLHPV